jgi:putative addiction module killer protein
MSHLLGPQPDMEAIPREILVCQEEDGREPFSEWLAGLDAKAEALVLDRIDRLEEGNFGDVQPVGQGVSELRIDFGPGYRVYFGQIGRQVHLIRGGTKKDQQRDIHSAKRFWSDHD